jgi:hypothetical protein
MIRRSVRPTGQFLGNDDVVQRRLLVEVHDTPFDRRARAFQFLLYLFADGVLAAKFALSGESD